MLAEQPLRAYRPHEAADDWQHLMLMQMATGASCMTLAAADFWHLQTLMLAESSFQPFKANRPREAADDWQHPVLQVSGEQLALRGEGQRAQAAFMQQVCMAV